MSRAKLCVILLNYANWRDTLECLESLARTSYGRIAVIVVDTGSPDDSVERLCAWVESGEDARPTTEVWHRLRPEVVQRPAAFDLIPPDIDPNDRPLPHLAQGLTIVSASRRLGFAAGCNAGLRIALMDSSVQYLWLLNNDTVVASDAPSHLVHQADSIGGSLGALGSLIADYLEPDLIQILGGGTVRRTSAEPFFPAHGLPISNAGAYTREISKLDYISGASLLTTVDAIREVGPLDDTMQLYWEDTDWCARLRPLGRQLAVCPQAVVWHKGHASTGGINHYTKYHNFRSATIYLRKHRKLWLPPLLVRLSKSLARDVLAARPVDALAALRGSWAGFSVPRANPRAVTDFLDGEHSTND